MNELPGFPTESELDWLDKFLSHRIKEVNFDKDKDIGIIDLVSLDGFMTAIVSSPDIVPISQWLPLIWGDFEPEFEDKTAFEHVFSLLIRYQNRIYDMLTYDNVNYTPYFPQSNTEGKKLANVHEWCEGYMKAVKLQLDQWQLDTLDMKILLAPIKAFTIEFASIARDDLSSEAVPHLLQAIKDNVPAIHDYWRQTPELFENGDLPQYEQTMLDAFSPQQLIGLMINDEDRVPRNVIDSCAARGDDMLEVLAPFARVWSSSEEEPDGHWWMRLHAIMILGLMPGEASGHMLIAFIDYIQRSNDSDLEEWLVGYWPALTRNKPDSIIEQIQAVSNNPQIYGYWRINLTEAVLASAFEQGGKVLEQALDGLVDILEDKNQDWNFRLGVGRMLLDFPRERYHEALNSIAQRQNDLIVSFNKNDIAKAYQSAKDNPIWKSLGDPWQFYQPSSILSRQQRWQQEGSFEEVYEDPSYDSLPTDSFYMDNPQPYRREAPKVGRNDPCPCGSGKKYKKCCLH